MTINVKRDFKLVTLAVSGRLDRATAPNLENTIQNLPPDTKELILDLAEVTYISSAGVRVLLGAYKMMGAVGAIRITGAGEVVREVLEMTGLLHLLSD